jgi:hypothetical protein
MKKSERNGKKAAAAAPRVPAPQPEPRGREARRLQGKALRKACPRSSHAGAPLGQGERDPLALIEASNRDRVEKLLPIRFTRMVESPFAFFRGTATL